MSRKYLFVVGGVMSSVGKGIASASIGKILQARGYRVTAMKIDPYVNVDAGTMNPTEHGEVFVTDDGDETDQDMGNYERFLGGDLNSPNYMTTGRVYDTVIHRERNLEYGGKCVQVVPHIPLEVIHRIKAAAQKARADITVIEVGGTVGEYENILFLEAARMMKLQTPEDVLVALVSYLPIPSMVGEMKTKPTQYAARSLNTAGLQADFIIARAERPLDKPRRERLAVFCNIPRDAAISAPDAKSVYHVPLMFEEQRFAEKILAGFRLKQRKADLKAWRTFVAQADTATKPLRLAVVGKYFGTGDFTLADSYISVIEATKHGSWANGMKPELTWIDSERYEIDSTSVRELGAYDGIIVPGGFGTRGIEGIITAIQYAREQQIPYLGLCYGMQLATVEFARNIAGLEGAHTTEVKKRPAHPVIHIMPDQEKKLLKFAYGGTMRLGAYTAKLKRGSVAADVYGTTKISERHRHRYEVNNAYRKSLEDAGLVIAGTSPDGQLVEMIELPTSVHPFFVGTQAHPEFKSRPLAPHALFVAFAKAAKQRSQRRG
ncbi:CTP synthase [Candidatus Berkelbacteria bacterium]|nr:CTP synthase [Candidatus Berkelbacteria bacterium]